MGGGRRSHKICKYSEVENRFFLSKNNIVTHNEQQLRLNISHTNIVKCRGILFVCCAMQSVTTQLYRCCTVTVKQKMTGVLQSADQCSTARFPIIAENSSSTFLVTVPRRICGPRAGYQQLSDICLHLVNCGWLNTCVAQFPIKGQVIVWKIFTSIK
ncbi:uncharacterized protein LOC120352706 [Nilaparvata lugens]|uniref:uncharacterized protein LOC120352706 n=1 Tax=Nilaparvata lugens TaxID=108931 RepID=UPI00193D3735|nr:uncharacterized protein LOC120352706 [Nilaparvata lugens]